MSRVLDTFLDLVRIDSPTGRERGVALYLAEALSSTGAEVSFDGSSSVTGSDTGNLHARLPGTAMGSVVMLAAHMDCVQPCEGVEPVVTDGIVRSAGATVLGGDDKNGCAAIVEVFRRLSESDMPRPEARAVFTVGEECGLLGAKALDPADLGGDLCLVLDADGPVGGIVTAAPAHYIFSATFTGRAAHAGVEPEAGVSAISMAAAAVSAMELGRIDERTTANIGTIAGGSAANVIAPQCDVTGECRSLDRARAVAVRDAMDAALKRAASDGGGSVDVKWALQYDGFAVESDAPQLALVEDACRAIGLTPRRFATGGGSDGNVFAAHGMPTLVLSSGMSKAHSVDEQVEVAELERLAALLVAVVHRAAE